MDKNDLTLHGIDGKIEVIERFEQAELGQWYWLRCEDQREYHDPIHVPADHEQGDALVCVTHVGSNYIEVQAPTSRYSNSTSTWRIHENEFLKELTFEPNAAAIIDENIQRHKNRVRKQLAHVQRVQREFGIPDDNLIDHQHGAQGNGNSLMVMQGNKNLTLYKKNLKHLKKHLLPKLFKRIKHSNMILSQWMSAETLVLKANIAPLETALSKVENQIFNVSLYAGLAEHSRRVKDGKPAAMNEKIHIMQRMMFMDEECLLDYDAGGMEFEKLDEFDAWLTRPNNFKRLLPFEKCIGIFRVRRSEKERKTDNQFSWWINIRLAQLDRFTFMYCRNGEQLHCLAIEDFEFEEKIFPDEDQFNYGEPLMAKMFAGRVDSLMSKRNWEDRIAKRDAMREASDKWRKENEGKIENAWLHNPYHTKIGWGLDEYVEFTPENVYYDDILNGIHKEIEKFNRTSLIIQGLFDRSDVFHPHPPIKTWEPESFNEHIKLVYDASMCLAYGEPPSFEEYLKKCNKSANKDSVFVGQYKAWRNKENHFESDYGPPRVARAKAFAPKAKRATFRWWRDRSWRTWGMADSNQVRASVTVPLDQLLNLSAYKKGDYKIFFNDHRTRHEYIKWAPFLLTAEDYVNGKIKLDKEYEENGL